MDWLKEQVPQGLEIGTFDGSLWISVVIFKMQKIRPRFVPAVKMVSDFNEINIRTYVTADSRQGVFFLSIEANKWLSCLIARTVSGLHYRQKAIDYDKSRVITDNLSFNYVIESKITEKKPFDLWVTERYCLYVSSGAKLFRYNIHHEEWPLNRLKATNLRIKNAGLLNNGLPEPEVCHYSPGVCVIAWARERIL